MTRTVANQLVADKVTRRKGNHGVARVDFGGGGDYAHTFPAIVDVPNVYPDLSGSGVDRGMLDDAVAVLGASRLLWGCDLTMETGLAKLRALDVIGLAEDAIADIRWGNAVRLFPKGSFPLATRDAVEARHAPRAVLHAPRQ